MLVFLTILTFILCILFVLMFRRIREMERYIDQIYHEALASQGDIEANAARSKENYKFIAYLNAALDDYKAAVNELTKMHIREK